ncbi:unnamed protein product [Camellia sinensis]
MEVCGGVCGTMTDSLLHLARNLSLTSEEDAVVRIGEDSTRLITGRSDLCLVGTLLTRKPFNVDAMKSCMLSVWQPTKGMQVRVIDDNLFVFSFGHVVDKRQVLLHGPWTFDKHLLMLGEMDPKVQPSDTRLVSVQFWVHVYNLPLLLMNTEVGTIVGNTIGEFVDMDFVDGGLAWGRSMRIRVALDIQKPLRRKVSLFSTDPLWVDFKYERLPIFCHFCGMLGHSERECDAKLSAVVAPIDVPQYGPWLRMDNFRSKGVCRSGSMHGAVRIGILLVLRRVWWLTRIVIVIGIGKEMREIEEDGCNRLDPSCGKVGLGVLQSNLGKLNKVMGSVAQLDPKPPTAILEDAVSPTGGSQVFTKKWKRAARHNMGLKTDGPFDTGSKRAFEEEVMPGGPPSDETSSAAIRKRLCVHGGGVFHQTPNLSTVEADDQPCRSP